MIESDWLFDLSGTCQRLAAYTLDGKRETFSEGLSVFRQGLPEPCSQLERLVLRDRLIITLTRAGHDFHEAFHMRASQGPCAGSPVSESESVWRDSERDPVQLLLEWTDRYLRSFDARHTWPAHWRAAWYVERHFREPLQLTHMARILACGRSALLRHFRLTFDLSIGEYQQRLRLREAVNELQLPDSKVDAVARLVGYGSPKNFYSALRKRTGLTPDEARNLGGEAFGRLFGRELRLVTEAL